MPFCINVQSQIVINEVSSANASVYRDFEGDYEDWIEIYNPGPTAISLADYYLETFDTKQKRWIFPDVDLKSDSCLLILCSGKNRRAVVDHYEVPSHLWENWQYMIGMSEPDTSWTKPTFNAASWSNGIPSIGYGDGDDLTVIPATTSVFVRDTFTISQTEDFLIAFLLMDYDDGFVAYINGVEVARNNLWTPGKPPYNAYASEEHEAAMYSCPSPDPVDCMEFFYIDEEKIQEALQPGLNVIGIQVHNYDLGLDDLTCAPFLIMGVQGSDTTFLNFPNTDNLHTNFNLSSFGQRISLKDPVGNLVDEYIIEAMHTDHSRGRYPDGSNNWCLMEVPSPCAPNSSLCKTGYAKPPIFSLEGGMYTGTQLLTISSPSLDPIYYSTNGSLPTAGSKLYSGPLSLVQTAAIRAVVVPLDSNLLSSRPVSATYILNESISLPVVSLITDSLSLFDPITGIYMLGPNVDTSTMEYPYWGVANYYQDIELAAHVEYFSSNGQKLLGQDCITKMHGNFSRGWPQKSFRFIATDKYGDNWFDFAPFPNKSTLNIFKSFNIRNGGVDYNTTHFRDGLMNRASRNLDLEYMDHEGCVLFLNGEYWGVYGMRERQDENYIGTNFNLDPDYVDLLRFSGDALNGSSDDFEEMANYIASSDLTDPSNYAQALDLLDISNFCDYVIAETYFNNFDWISEGGNTNNIKFWKYNAPSTKFRYVLWDTDLGLALSAAFVGSNPAAIDYLGLILDTAFVDPHSLMLQNLFTNPTFKNYYINRFADVVNTEFSPSKFGAVAQTLYDEFEPEMARHFSKWGAPPKLIWGAIWLGRASNVPEWTSEFDSILSFINDRPAFARDNMETLFALNKQIDITLNVQPAGAGEIHINTITPESLPWTGVYFDGVPVTITAIENPGFKFNSWQSNSLFQNGINDVTFTVNVDTNEAFTAFFESIGYDLMAYPVPFSTSMTIEYHLMKEEQVSLKVIDMSGREACVILDYSRFQPEGANKITFDPSEYNLPNGMYILELKTSGFKKSVKIIKAESE
ncbi:MAG: hypothetical protein ACI9J3_001470 [Parvicellaceae bacterium]|jgi:hypothetical protein